MFRGFATISFYADDLAAARDWYAELFGVEAYYVYPPAPYAYPPPTAAARADGERVPRAGSAAEAEFLALGPGASSWLVEAAGSGARGVRRKMAEAVALAKLHPPGEVDRALGTAAVAGRFAENDVLRILAHQAGRDVDKPTIRASETHNLQPGTAAWSGPSGAASRAHSACAPAASILPSGRRRQ